MVCGEYRSEDCTEAGAFFRLMSEVDKRQLMDAIAAAMAGLPEFVVLREIARFAKADPSYGAGVAERLGIATIVTAE